VHEIKLDGFRIAARIDNGRVQLLIRTGLDWSARYPNAIEALASVNVKTAYLDGELCGVDKAGLPSFAHTQALDLYSRVLLGRRIDAAIPATIDKC
jgi:ATP-dependent DNA ligase